MRFVQVFSPSRLRREGEIHVIRENFVKSLRTNPSVAEMLDAFPTLGGELTTAMEAQVDTYISEYDAQFFPRAAEIVRDGLSRDDVRALTTFYESPLGQKLQHEATQNVDGSEVGERGMKGEDIDSGVANRQAIRSGIAAARALSTEERNQVLAFAASPAGQHFHTLRPKIVALQVELMNRPGEKFKEATKKALAEVMDRVVGSRSEAH